jgi:hypothetical protein
MRRAFTNGCMSTSFLNILRSIHPQEHNFYSKLTCSRYWFQRYKIWENYDEGIWMTEDAWFGVTPEPIAKYNTLLSTDTDD